MLKTPPNRLLQALRRLSGPASEDADASLLERFVRDREEAAFEALLHRHGDMVLRVCRRHLDHADAEDAFQAVFLVLARDAARIGRRESLAGWLFRVAYFVSRKAMGKAARRKAVSLREGDRAADFTDDAAREETRAAVEEEVAALPDRLRAPVVLCYLEGHSNSEAAALLGCPRGTIDSRLAAARKKLHARLLKRGIALSGVLALESLWQSEGHARVVPSLVARTVQAVSQFARTGSAAGVAAQQVLKLAAGVANTMSTNRMTMLAAFAVMLTLAGGTGITVFNVQADGQKPAAAEQPKEKPKPGAPPTIAKLETTEEAAAAKGPQSPEEVRDILRQPYTGIERVVELPLDKWIDSFTFGRGLSLRFDVAAFKRLRYSISDEGLEQYPVRLPAMKDATIGDVLKELLARIKPMPNPEGGEWPSSLAYRIRNNQIFIVPGYMPTGQGAAGKITGDQLLEQEMGEPVTLSIKDKSFADAVEDLRRTTGANIVIDSRQTDKTSFHVSATLNDVRLLSALRVLADMCELAPVAMDNVYYITSKSNAAELQKEMDQKRFSMPAGGVQLPPGGGGIGPSSKAPPEQPKPKKDEPKKQ